MLRISDNRRFLVHSDGSPFFFLADSGWTLLHRLDRDETVHYLGDRVAKGFTVIQVMGISEFDGLSVPNALGDLPFHGADPARPTKPCLDGETCYEDHAINWDVANGNFDDHDARKTAYRALFAGAHGHTYGANGVFQFWKGDGDGDRFGVRRRWQEALALPGAAQMDLVRRLIEYRPMLSRVSDQGLLASDPGTGGEHLRATREAYGAYAFVYSPTGRPFAVDLGKLSGEPLEASWVDPRTGESRPAGTRPAVGAATFAPPTSGTKVDWILVLDDADRRFSPPGSPAA